MEEATSDRSRGFMIEDILGVPMSKDDSESANEAGCGSPSCNEGIPPLIASHTVAKNNHSDLYM